MRLSEIGQESGKPYDDEVSGSPLALARRVSVGNFSDIATQFYE